MPKLIFIILYLSIFITSCVVVPNRKDYNPMENEREPELYERTLVRPEQVMPGDPEPKGKESYPTKTRYTVYEKAMNKIAIHKKPVPLDIGDKKLEELPVYYLQSSIYGRVSLKEDSDRSIKIFDNKKKHLIDHTLNEPGDFLIFVDETREYHIEYNSKLYGPFKAGKRIKLNKESL